MKIRSLFLFLFSPVIIFSQTNSLLKEGKDESFYLFILICILFLLSYVLKLKNIKIRRITAIESVDEAIGRATEMGKPILYISGLKPVPAVSAIAAMNVLGEVARVCGNYNTPIVSPHSNSITMLAATEEIKEGFNKSNNPDLMSSSSIFYVTESQFPFAASVNALTNRVKPGAIFYMGTFYAESLILTEHGSSTGAIQIAGTDSVAQMPFFITTCDYLLIGEELFAASAYINRDIEKIKGLLMLDIAKAIIVLYILIRLILVNI